jgi:hypothetical protein
VAVVFSPAMGSPVAILIPQNEQDLRDGPNRVIRSGTLSSFGCSFFARRAKKRTTAKMGSTMLPIPLSLSKGRQSDV